MMLCDVNTFERRRPLWNSPVNVLSVAFSADGNLLAASAGDCLLLYDLRSRDPVPWRIKLPLRCGDILAIAPDGSTLITATGAGGAHKVYLWDISRCWDHESSEN